MMKIYLILDRVSGQNSPLFLEKNDASAQRQFASFLSQATIASSDYDMYCLGTFHEMADECLPYIVIDTQQITRHVVNGAVVRPSTSTEE